MVKLLNRAADFQRYHGRTKAWGPVNPPKDVATTLLEQEGDWTLQPVVGISTAPLLAADASVRVADGYDPATALWCSNIPTLNVQARPSKSDAQGGLASAAAGFPHFPFRPRREADPSLGVETMISISRQTGTKAAFSSPC